VIDTFAGSVVALDTARRMPQPIDTSSSHVGFRCIVRPDAPLIVRSDERH